MVVTQLFSYPLKSAAPLSLKQTVVTPFGLLNDRIFAVVGTDNSILTARERPRLLRITAKVELNELLLSRHGAEALVCNLHHYKKPESLNLFSTRVSGDDLGPEASEWVSQAVGTPARIFALSAPVSKGGKRTPQQYKTFMDTSPIHLIAEASLADLNKRLKTPMTIERFRPNIVVSGSPAFAEDSWQVVKINGCTFDVHLQCMRCVLTTIDPQTGEPEMDGEPLRTLSTYRKQGNGIAFGIYLIPRQAGAIHLNDTIEIMMA